MSSIFRLRKPSVALLARVGLARVGLAALLLLTSGCVRQVRVSEWFGALRPQKAVRAIRRLPKAVAGNRQAAPAANPDDALRETLRTQTRGAFDPLTDDRRISLLQTRLRLDPQDLQAHLELAGLYESYKLYDEALDQYTRALNLCVPAPDSRPAPAAQTAAVGIGRTARNTAQGAAALPVLAAFLKAAPESANVWNELGLLHEQAGDRAVAEQAFRRAVAIQPISSRFHSNLGYNLLQQNQLAAAEAELRRAVELDSHSAAAHNNLGITLARRGDLNGALRQFMTVSDPATAHNNLAVVLMEMGQYEKSREELIKSLAARNYFAPAMENFKLVQQLLRERAEKAKAGHELPLDTVRLPALADQPVNFTKEQPKSVQPENRP